MTPSSDHRTLHAPPACHGVISLTGALSNRTAEALATSIFPVQRASSCPTRRASPISSSDQRSAIGGWNVRGGQMVGRDGRRPRRRHSRLWQAVRESTLIRGNGPRCLTRNEILDKSRISLPLGRELQRSSGCGCGGPRNRRGAGQGLAFVSLPILVTKRARPRSRLCGSAREAAHRCVNPPRSWTPSPPGSTRSTKASESGPTRHQIRIIERWTRTTGVPWRNLT